MGKCKVYNDKMWQDYLQNKLDREELAGVQFHLHHCVCCRERLKQMRLMIQDMETSTGQREWHTFRIRKVFRMVTVITLLLSVSIGGYVWVRTSFDEGSTIIITSPPVYNTIDSVKNAIDSIAIEDKKDSIHYEADSINNVL